MSMEFLPVVMMPIVSPQSEAKPAPWILDESVPHPRNPQEVYNEKMKEQIIQMAKCKPDDERNFLDYLILAQEKMKDLSSPQYYA